MEFDLVRSIERNAELPPVFPSAARFDSDEISLELSLGSSSRGGSCRKRLTENNEAVQGKKSRIFESFFEPEILQVQDGCSLLVPGLFPSSGAEVGTAISAPQPAGIDEASSPACGASGISDAFQTSSSLDMKSCSNESNSGPKHSPVHAARGDLAGRTPAARMPVVSTKSAGGQKIKGRLHRSWTNEVHIICDCHGRIFSPAFFIRHAGGLDTSNPLRQITVVCSD